jgi:hypothetical protein
MYRLKRKRRKLIYLASAELKPEVAVLEFNFNARCGIHPA